ncbi:hypothetical protein N183_14870 [Sinorhizobium sp. Sb3]|uniref:reprolysin-like metallopeptidase n=1 Tax=Sinorhizobium sp. Sb3 TaxID=1358417 RepID=UPI00071DA4B4|nr:M12 family metallo-peptidase [Sinorhizobium sp. Sb3]KSV81793.1 hypothetical protein N183_14870 [Sinorhizobium sp. Sb3]
MRFLLFVLSLLMMFLLQGRFPALAQELVRLLPSETALTPAQSEQMKSIAELPSTEGVWLVEVDLSRIRGSATVVIALADGKSVTLTGDEKVPVATSDFAWSGESASSNSGEPSDWAEATITVEGDRIAATIRTANELYRIQPIGEGLHALIKVSDEKLPSDHGQLRRDRTSIERNVRTEDLRAKSDKANAVLDVLVLVTGRAANGIGSSNLQIFAKNAADAANRSFANSGIRARIQLTSVRRVEYTEAASLETDTSRLAGRSDGYMDGIHAIRDRENADLVVLLSANNSACGWSHKVYASANSAFASVYFDCAVNNLSFAHEIGHLLGACHNPEVSTGCPFAYGHGFLKPARRERTVMAYPCPQVKCIRRAQWSRPSNWGTARKHHAARVIDETAPRASNFR